MPKRRKFEGEPVSRLIVSVPVSIVGEIDQLTSKRYPRPERHNLDSVVMKYCILCEFG